MKNILNNYFYLHKWCIPVRGVVRSTVCDFQRGEVVFIPNELCEILEKFNGKKLQPLLIHTIT